jgi:hypothetical protein
MHKLVSNLKVHNQEVFEQNETGQQNKMLCQVSRFVLEQGEKKEVLKNFFMYLANLILSKTLIFVCFYKFVNRRTQPFKSDTHMLFVSNASCEPQKKKEKKARHPDKTSLVTLRAALHKETQNKH